MLLMLLSPKFTCFTGTKAQILTQELHALTDAHEASDAPDASGENAWRHHLQFTCFTSTKVQILTQKHTDAHEASDAPDASDENAWRHHLHTGMLTYSNVC
jgi:hypothetical protein